MSGNHLSVHPAAVTVVISDDEDERGGTSECVVLAKGESRRGGRSKRARSAPNEGKESEVTIIVDCDVDDTTGPAKANHKKNSDNNDEVVSVRDDADTKSSAMRSGGAAGMSFFFPPPSATLRRATIITVTPRGAAGDQPKTKCHRAEEAEAQRSQPQLQQNGTSLSVRTQFVDAMNPHRGAFSICKLPISDLLTPAAFQKMLALCPTQRGQVKMLGKVIDTPRYFQMYLHSYTFTGLVHAAEAELPEIFQPILDWLNSDSYAEATAAATGGGDQQKRGDYQQRHKFNGVLVNWYMDGSDYIGPHADSTAQLHPRTDIVTVSFGASRVFRIRGPSSAFSLIPSVNSNKRGGGRKSSSSSSSAAAANHAILHDVAVRNGDVLVMHGAFQEHYKHEIVKVTGAAALATTGPRISVTFRQYK